MIKHKLQFKEIIWMLIGLQILEQELSVKAIVDVPRNNFYGALWSIGNTKSASASVLVNHDFNKNWKLNFNSSFQTYDRYSKSTAQLSTVQT